MPQDNVSLPPHTNNPLLGRKTLLGFQNFVRHNPKTDLSTFNSFHHVEFWCTDATTSYKRFQTGLGLQLVAKSDLSTGNETCYSYVLMSNQLTLAFTAPQAILASKSQPCKCGLQMSKIDRCPLYGYDQRAAFEFVKEHGLAVRAVGIAVQDAKHAYAQAVANGGVGVLQPIESVDQESGEIQCVAEIKLYGDVVLRFVSGEFKGPFLTNFLSVDQSAQNFRLQRLDHCVGNVYDLFDTVEYIMRMTGFHEFAEFSADDVGTHESGLNSMVLANNNEYVLLPVNEPTVGTKRQSQIKTYLDYNQGPGVQHLALKSDDIFYTLMKMRECVGGFEFMPPPPKEYYDALPSRVGKSLTKKQIKKCQELGILVDKDDQGVLLQIFTQPVGDRPTIFFEIIQRIGCKKKGKEEHSIDQQEAGCGGFGKGNFSELFKSIENYERQLEL